MFFPSVLTWSVGEHFGCFRGSSYLIGLIGALRDRLQIYAEGHRLRFVEPLTYEFPALRRTLALRGFDQMARAIIEAYPGVPWRPSCACIHLTPSNHSFLNLTALKWALSEAFDAADSIAVGVDTIAALAPETWPTMRLPSEADERWTIDASRLLL